MLRADIAYECYIAYRGSIPYMTAESFSKLRAAEHSSLSVHHNSYLLTILYDVTGEEKHKEMLYRVVSDLV
jgi:hypothetical protein